MTYKVSDIHVCPICGNPEARIVLKGKDGRIIGVKCQKSHGHKRNSVVLMEKA